MASRYGLNRLGARGLVILAAAAITAGVALNWSWLVAIGMAPLLLTVIPCAVMCALGICMMPKGEKATSDDIHQDTTAKTQSDD